MADPQYIAGESLVAGNACYMKTDGRMWKALAPQPVEAICKSVTVAAGVLGDFHPAGVITYGSWSGAGLPIYLSSTVPGLLTITEPTGIEDPQQIGVTRSTTTMMWNIDLSTESIRKVRFLLNGSEIGTQRGLNFITGTNTTVIGTNDDSLKKVDMTIAISAAGAGGGGPFLSVKDYPSTGTGAVGDGNADDTAKIQAAINYLNSLTPSGGVLWFPKGTYKTTSVLTLYSNITLAGVGMGGSKIFSSHNGNVCISIVGRTNVGINNLAIYSTDNTSATYSAIYLENNTNIIIEDCEISYIRQYGIYCESVVNNNITILNNYFHHIHTTNHGTINDAVGIVAHYLNESRITNNYFTLCGGSQQTDHAIYGGRYSNKLLIYNNIMDSNPGGNIQFYNDGTVGYNNDNIVISNNIITNAVYWGIIVTYTRKTSILNNLITMVGATNKPGIEVYAAHNTDYIVGGNLIKTNYAKPNGMIIATGSRGLVHSNYLIGEGTGSSRGINIGYDGVPTDISVFNNLIYNVYIGILILGTASFIRLQNNTVNIAITGTSIESSADYVSHINNVYKGVTTNLSGTGLNFTDRGTVDW
jgi:hypothetical protein